MEFSTTAGALREALTMARHATPAHPTIAAYTGVLLEVTDGQVSFTGSDGETTITAIAAANTRSTGQILLLPRPLGNFLANLESNETIYARLNSTEDLEVEPEGSSAYSFRRMVASFSTPNQPKTAPRSVDLSRLDLAIAAIRSSTVKDMPGVQLVSSESGLTLHTTDNYRLSRAILPEGGFGVFTGLVSLNILERVARMNINEITVDPKGRTLRFSGPSVAVTTRLLSMSFPDVSGFLEFTPPSEAVFSIAQLRRLLPRLNSVAEQSPLKVRLEGKLMTLSASNVDLGTGSESLQLSQPVPVPFEFLVKPAFLLDVCNSHDSEHITLGYTSPTEPLFVRSIEKLEVTSVLMPIKA